MNRMTGEANARIAKKQMIMDDDYNPSEVLLADGHLGQSHCFRGASQTPFAKSTRTIHFNTIFTTPQMLCQTR